MMGCMAGAAWGQTIPNPSFEANSFTTAPGYISLNALISGWTASNNIRAGLNPASGNPFADNGAIPDGANVAFIQSTGAGSTSLSTTISGLTAGQGYKLRFRANCRSAYTAPTASFAINGVAPVAFSAAPSVGGSAPYYSVAGDFLASGPTAALVITNATTGVNDSTLLVDDFSIAPSTAWMVSPWKGDATAGIYPESKWAYHFGSNSPATIAGKSVGGINGGNPSSAGQFTITGVPQTFNNDTNALTALGGNGSAVVGHDFIWGGNPAVVTLQGLTPGLSYVVTFLSVGFDAAASRTAYFSSGGQGLVQDQNTYNNDKGLRVEHAFIADATTRTIRISQEDVGQSFHIYALALRQGPVVRNINNAGSGSLRQALADAAVAAGDDVVTFDPALSGQSIILTSQLIINDGNTVAIDGGGLPRAPTLTDEGNASHRLCRVDNSGGEIQLRNLTFADGGPTADPNGAEGTGGAIRNDSSLLYVYNCAFLRNFAKTGGAIHSGSGLSIAHFQNCTFSGNSDQTGGGAVHSINRTELTHCTFSGNTGGTASGAGIYAFNTLWLYDSIVAGNSPGNITLAGGGAQNGGHNQIGGDPQLAPLDFYGGPTQTMLPLPGSPALDAAEAPSIVTTDQRGFVRERDGDGNGSGISDIGAVEVRRVLVNTNADDLGLLTQLSLREAVYADVGTDNADHICFDPAVFTGGVANVITFAAANPALPINNGIIIDASNIPGGVTVNAAAAEANPKRVFDILDTGAAVLRGLTISGGYLSDNSAEGQGGGVRNQGHALLQNCVISGNRAAGGGGASNLGTPRGATLALQNCAISSNTSLLAGGGLLNMAPASATSGMKIENCTINGNTVALGGGGLMNWASGGTASCNLTQSTVTGNSAITGAGCYNYSTMAGGSATLTMIFCTISGNTATNKGGGVIVWQSDGSTVTEILSTILAGNTAATAADGPDVYSLGGALPVSGGRNLIGKTDGSGVAWLGTDLTGTDANPRLPLLTPLGNYGGTLNTMALLPGSPAINAGGGSIPFVTDQRGVARDVTPEIGAVEYAGSADLTLYWNQDWDGDGVAYGAEFALGTDPLTADKGSPLSPNIHVLPNGKREITFGYNPAAIGKVRWKLRRSLNLTNWATAFTSDGTTHQPSSGFSTGFSVAPYNLFLIGEISAPFSKLFFRLEAEQILP